MSSPCGDSPCTLLCERTNSYTNQCLSVGLHGPQIAAQFINIRIVTTYSAILNSLSKTTEVMESGIQAMMLGWGFARALVQLMTEIGITISDCSVEKQLFKSVIECFSDTFCVYVILCVYWPLQKLSDYLLWQLHYGEVVPQSIPTKAARKICHNLPMSSGSSVSDPEGEFLMDEEQGTQAMEEDIQVPESTQRFCKEEDFQDLLQKCTQKGQTARGTGNPGGSLLATQTMVRNNPASSGGETPVITAPYWRPENLLLLGYIIILGRYLSGGADKKKKKKKDPLKTGLWVILEFLQGLDKGLKPSTLRRQVAALATVIPKVQGFPLAKHPHVTRFLRGATVVSPPAVHRFPTWSLSVVLSALLRQPFEPLQDISLRHLRLKVIFLVAVTFARRISELGALSIRKDLWVFYKDKVVLWTDPIFRPKVESRFHRLREINLPTFFPDPKHPKEVLWHRLDVRRALKAFLICTEPFRRSESMFISISPPNKGERMSTVAIGTCLRDCIAETYSSLGRPVPSGITAHSVRGAATNAAMINSASVEQICKAATWSSISTFIRHYKLSIQYNTIRLLA
ncbi:uncharacterized protein LOC143831152 [Paroedura picta]|uniref:uncharacterized protein LOC143831152 n=1 Tax=Paroedura picta TaxID=143630 RepID=UPI004056DCFB